MRWDGRRQRWILQARTFGLGLVLLSALIALAMQVGFRIPEAEGARLGALVFALACLVWMTLKINFTILLGVQVELYPGSGRLEMSSILNRDEVSGTVRAVEVELPTPETGGPASLTIVAEDESYTLPRWLSTPENDRLYETQARRIGRTLNVPVRVMRAGEPRRTTPVSKLRFRPLLDRIKDDDGPARASLPTARRRLVEAAGKEPGVELSGEGPSLDLRWFPDRSLGRSFWIVAGAMLAMTAVAGLRGWAPALAEPLGYGALIAVAAFWLWLGMYVYFAREQLRLHEGLLTHRLAGPLGWLFSPLFSPAEALVVDIEEVWVGGEDPIRSVYIETRFEPIEIQANPLAAEDLAGAVSDAVLTFQSQAL